MVDLTEITLLNGIPVGGDGNVKTINALMADGGLATVGNMADPASDETGTGEVSAMSVWKQMSLVLQAIEAVLPLARAGSGGLKVQGDGTAIPVSVASVPSHAVTNSGSFPTQSKNGHTASVTFTTGTTGYVPGDAVGVGAGSAIHTFAGAAASAQEIEVESIELLIARSGVISGETTYRLHLFNAAPTSISDSAAFDLQTADISKYLGYVDLPAVIDMGSVIYSQADNLRRRVRSAGTDLVGVLVANGTYTPTAVAHTLRMRTREV